MNDAKNNAAKIDFILRASNAKIEDVAAKFEAGARNLHEALSDNDMYINVPSSYMDIAMSITSLDGVPGYNSAINEGAQISIGKTYVIIEGAGMDTGKIVTAVQPSNIKIGFDGVPTNVRNSYRRPQWNKETAVMFEDGSYGIVAKEKLSESFTMSIMYDIAEELGAKNALPGMAGEEAEGENRLRVDYENGENSLWLNSDGFVEGGDIPAKALSILKRRGMKLDESKRNESLLASDYEAVRDWAGEDIANEDIDSVVSAYAKSGKTMHESLEELKARVDADRDSTDQYEQDDFYNTLDEWINTAAEAVSAVLDMDDEKLRGVLWGMAMSATGYEATFADGDKAPADFPAPKMAETLASMNPRMAGVVRRAINEGKVGIAYGVLRKYSKPKPVADPVNEGEGKKIYEAIEMLRNAQDNLREAVTLISSARRIIGNDSRESELLYRYVLGHLEPMIDNEHMWLTRNTSLQDVIDSLKEEDEIEEHHLDTREGREQFLIDKTDLTPEDVAAMSDEAIEAAYKNVENDAVGTAKQNPTE